MVVIIGNTASRISSIESVAISENQSIESEGISNSVRDNYQRAGGVDQTVAENKRNEKRKEEKKASMAEENQRNQSSGSV